MFSCLVLNKKMYLCKIRNESSYTMELKTLIAAKKQITRKKKEDYYSEITTLRGNIRKMFRYLETFI